MIRYYTKMLAHGKSCPRCPGTTPGVGGDPKVILLATFFAWEKNLWMTDGHRDRLVVQNSDYIRHILGIN